MKISKPADIQNLSHKLSASWIALRNILGICGACEERNVTWEKPRSLHKLLEQLHSGSAEASNWPLRAAPRKMNYSSPDAKWLHHEWPWLGHSDSWKKYEGCIRWICTKVFQAVMALAVQDNIEIILNSSETQCKIFFFPIRTFGNVHLQKHIYCL